MPNKEVIGFYPNWLSPDLYLSLRYDAITTIAWSFLGLNADGSFSKQSYPPLNLINYAHSKGVKVVVALNPGWGSSTIDTILASPSLQSTVVNNLLTEVQQNGFDGVDIDFEGFPVTNTVNGQSNRTLFTNFIELLSTTFWNSNPNYRLSIDLPAVDWNNVFDVTTLQYYVNYLMIMGYDYHWQTGPTAGAVAPLTSPNGVSVTDSVDTYLTKISRDKLLLGVPYYGYEWQTQTNQPDSPTLGGGMSVTYSNIIDTKLSVYPRQWSSIWSSPYYLTSNGQGWYDDETSLGLKYDLVNNRGLAGIGIWALGYDTSHQELGNLIINKFGAGSGEDGGGGVGIPLSQNKLLLGGIVFVALILILD